MPLKLNRRAEKEGARLKVFAASLADVFDNQVPVEWRSDLFALIKATPNLDWQLLTKRPQNIRKMLPADWGDGWPNVWLGTTAENQTEADRRVPHLLGTPAAVRFVSYEPALGPVDWTRIEAIPNSLDAQGKMKRCGIRINSLTGQYFESGMKYPNDKIDWIICGGESGPNARPMHPAWARQTRDQCAAAGVAFFFKQWGEFIPVLTDDDGNGVVCHENGASSPAFESTKNYRIVTSGNQEMWHIGKKLAGTHLDGVQHLAFPEGRK